MSDHDSEVERIMTGRPPSSYGSMCSDDPEDDEIQDDEIQDAAPQPIITVNLSTKIKLHRPDSPGTTITSVTQDPRTSVRNEGVYITAQSNEQEPGEVTMEVEDNESYVHPRESQTRERRVVHVEQSIQEPTFSLPATASQSELDLPFVFRGMLHSLRTLKALELQCFVRSLCSRRNGELELRQLEQEGEIDVLGVVDQMLEKWEKGEALYITVRTLYDINKREISSALASVCRRALVQFELKTSHKRQYYSLYEGLSRPGQQRYIRHVYMETPIVVEFPAGEGTPIRISDLFSPREGNGRVRVAVTTGIPAIGLSVNVQMFIMDWAEERVCQDFQFVFALPAYDLHLVRNSDQTFLEFLSTFYPEAKEAQFLACPDCAMLFIIDGLERCKHPLGFQNNASVTEITAQAPVDVLITSLIKGDLLPHACVWITGHRLALRKIPPNCINRVTELKGFGDAEKDEYFTKRTKDPTLGQRVLEHVKRSPLLYDACYLPFFSWIVSFIYEWRLETPVVDEPLPVVTTFFAQYVTVVTNRKIERYFGTGFDASRWKDTDKAFTMKMGELALRMLREGTSVFYEDTVSQMELDMDEVTHRSAISFETLEPMRGKGRSFRFVHHSIQVFMAALYVYVRFRMKGENALESHAGRTKADRSVSELYKPAINLVLSRRDGNMDLFLRFLFGMAAYETEMQLRGHLMPQYHPVPKGVEEVFKYARKKIKENAAPERCRNLELCVKELEEGRRGPDTLLRGRR